MPIIKHIQEDKFQIGIWKITESEDEFLTSLSAYPDICEQVNRFKSNTRKIEFLSVRRLILEILGYIPVINYTESGKPYIENNTLYISISHTQGAYAAVLLSTEPFIGIDIEVPSERVTRVENKFLSDDEKSLTLGKVRTEALMIFWSAKETLFKAIDTNEIDFKKHLKIKNFTHSKIGEIEAEFCKEKDFWKGSIHYISNDHYILTWIHRT